MKAGKNKKSDIYKDFRSHPGLLQIKDFLVLLLKH